MEVPRLGVESQIQLLACTTATATWDPNYVCKLHHSSWQQSIPEPLSEARDQTCIFIDTSQIHFLCTTMVTPYTIFIYLFICLFAFFRAAPAAWGSSQARGLIRAVAAGLRQSHSNTGLEPRLQSTPQLTATPDP